MNSAGASLPRSGPPIAYSNLYVQALQQDGATQMPPLALIGGYVPTNPPPIALRKVGTKKLPKLGNLGRPPRGLPKLVNLGRPLGPKKFPTRPTWTSFGLLEITQSELFQLRSQGPKGRESPHEKQNWPHQHRTRHQNGRSDQYGRRSIPLNRAAGAAPGHCSHRGRSCWDRRVPSPRRFIRH